MQKKYQTISNNRGFTLIELLIAMVVGSIIMFAVYKIYVANQRTYTAQLAVTEMQQNMRVAIDLLSSDIRMAGYATAGNPAGAGIVDARPDLISFTADLNEDGAIDDSGEHVAYDIYISSGNPVLGKITSAGAITGSNISGDHWEVTAPAPPGHQPAAENIEHLRFRYLSSLTGAGVVAATNADILFVQVDVVVRAGQADPDFLNTQTYTAADGTNWVKNDHFRRRHQRFIIECRNANH